jgi:SAM-dependent methyltransferase
MHPDEKERITQVYLEYDCSLYVQRRRNPLNPGNIHIRQERERMVEQVLITCGLTPLSQRRILEVGCGFGSVLESLLRLGAQPENLHGMDLLPDRIEACRKAHPRMHFATGNAERLDFPAEHFDLVLAFTMFSSILDETMAHNVANEVGRVLRPGGGVLWYDLRYGNPWNPSVRGMTKRRIHSLFADLQMCLRSVTLLPPLARRLGAFTDVLYPLLITMRPLRTHYLGLLLKCK